MCHFKSKKKKIIIAMNQVIVENFLHVNSNPHIIHIDLPKNNIWHCSYIWSTDNCEKKNITEHSHIFNTRKMSQKVVWKFYRESTLKLSLSLSKYHVNSSYHFNKSYSIVARNIPHHSKIKICKSAIVSSNKVSWMWISMEKSHLKQLPQRTVQSLWRQMKEEDKFGTQHKITCNVFD